MRSDPFSQFQTDIGPEEMEQQSGRRIASFSRAMQSGCSSLVLPLQGRRPQWAAYAFRLRAIVFIIALQVWTAYSPCGCMRCDTCAAVGAFVSKIVSLV